MLINGARIGPKGLVLALLASMGGFIFGFDTGQISDMLLMSDFLTRFATCTDYTNSATCQFSNVRTGLIVSMLSIGTAFGALIGASIADRFGRRRAITYDSMVVIIGSIIQVSAVESWVQLMVGRIVTGLGIGALSAVIPLYQSETAPKEIRGSLVATYQLMITGGILAAYAICIGTRSIKGSAASGSWRIVIALNMLWALILGVGIMFAPESPRWLMMHDREDEAEHALALVRGVDVDSNDFAVKQSFNEMKDQVALAEAMDDFQWWECFKIENKTLYRTVLLMVLQSIQQLTGANYFFYYGATVFTSVGLADSFVTQIILGAVNFVSTFAGIYILERFGRRMPLIIGGIWQSFWLFVFAAAGTAVNPATNQGIGNLMIVSACFFIAGYAMTWGPAIWILVGETFPTQSRAKQGALATSANWIWNFLIGFFTPYITSAISFRYGFVFAACNLAGSVIVFFFLYESSKLSLEAVDDMYNDPSVRAWRSGSWVPVGHESRSDYNDAMAAEAKSNALKNVEHRELADSSSDVSTNNAILPPMKSEA